MAWFCLILAKSVKSALKIGEIQGLISLDIYNIYARNSQNILIHVSWVHKIKIVQICRLECLKQGSKYRAFYDFISKLGTLQSSIRSITVIKNSTKILTSSQSIVLSVLQNSASYLHYFCRNLSLFKHDILARFCLILAKSVKSALKISEIQYKISQEVYNIYARNSQGVLSHAW